MPASQQEEGLAPSRETRNQGVPADTELQGSRSVYFFGSYRLDVRERRLSCGDAPIALPPKAFDLLHVLVRHDGQLVEKKTLLRTVWPDTFVEEGNLSVYISLLRKTLGKATPDEEFIETIPKSGYRFMAPVTLCPPSAEAQTRELSDSLHQEKEAAAPAQENRWLPRWPWLALFALVLALCFGTALLFLRILSHRQQAIHTAGASQPLTSVPGVFSSPSFSPDGESLAYAWRPDRGNLRNIYIQSIGSDQRRQITSEGGDNFSPAWSPHGDEIAFLHAARDAALGGELEVLIAGSRTPGRLRRIAVINNVGSAFHDPPTLSWSPDGSWLLTDEKDGAGGSAPLVLLSVSNAQKRVLTHPPAQTVDDNAVFSPNGKFVAFLRARGPSSGQILIVSVAGGPERRIPFPIHSIDGLTWSADGQSLLVSSSRALSVGTLWRVDLRGDPPIALSSLPAHTADPALSSIAHRLAYIDVLRNVSLWREPADGHGAAEQVIASGFIDSAPDYSSDGSQIAFDSDRSGATEIWVGRSDGQQTRMVTHFDGPETGSPRWSPDGRTLAFDSRLNGRSVIFTVPASGGTPVLMTAGPFAAADNVVPTWSRDGRALYFSSNRTGRWEVWRMDIDSRAARQITPQGGFNGVESPDGKSLYYVQDTTSTTIWRVPLNGGRSQQVTGSLGPGMWGYWAIEGDNLFYLQRTGGGASPASIDRLNLRTGARARLGKTQFGVNPSDKGLTISPDGRWLIFAQCDIDRSSIMLVNNWY